MNTTSHIAVIGAGLAGLTAAHNLAQRFSVKVFEKSRGPSGRMATRYGDDFEFDHGAQSFTARSAEFKAFLKPFIDSGTLRNWPDNERYVASPRMNALGKAIAQDLDLVLGTRISNVSSSGTQWELTDDQGQGQGVFDWVICAAPQPQTIEIMPERFARMDTLVKAKMLPAFTVMAGLDYAWPHRWAHKRFDGGVINEVSVNNMKPGRPIAEDKTSLVMQADNQWAAERVDQDKNLVLSALISEFKTRSGVDLTDAAHLTIHRWLYANVMMPAGEFFLIDHPQRLAVCGDWCIAGRVEAAFLSGHALAHKILQLA